MLYGGILTRAKLIKNTSKQLYRCIIVSCCFSSFFFHIIFSKHKPTFSAKTSNKQYKTVSLLKSTHVSKSVLHSSWKALLCSVLRPIQPQAFTVCYLVCYYYCNLSKRLFRWREKDPRSQFILALNFWLSLFLSQCCNPFSGLSPMYQDKKSNVC